MLVDHVCAQKTVDTDSENEWQNIITSYYFARRTATLDSKIHFEKLRSTVVMEKNYPF